MNISAPFIQRPIATSLLMAAIFLIGLVAFPSLPVAPLPQVDFPTMLVTTTLPGASSETMASTVATPLENQFSQIPGVAQMTSTSVLGSAQITIQFDLDRNIDAASQDIQAAINVASAFLPKNLPSPPSYRKINPAEASIVVFAIHSDALPATTVDDYAENVILPRMSQIAGVGLVSIGGQQKPAIRVQIDPAKIAAMGIQLEDIANVILTATVNQPKGSINGATHNFVVYDNDQLLKAAPWNDVIIAYKNGAPVRVRDIGIAVDGPENNQLTAWQNGKNGILLQVYKQPGANIIDVVSHIDAALPQVLAAVPSSLKIDKIIDRTTTIKASVEDVEFTLSLTIVLVVIVIFLFLRNIWATIIPSVTIPL
ncbi:MAG TPA: efflux RND transporter permease subunit, partial [Burkholderiaceae bacterium]|nr:efflux RND transporter permease subunit [Burkholderiaceae bacterium]